MTDGKTRRPAAFRLDNPGVLVEDPLAPEGTPKAPRGKIVVTPEPDDVFAEPSGGALVVMPPARRRFRFGRWFMAAFGALLSLALGIWVTDFVTGLFARSDWLGWTGAVLAGATALALLAFIAREAAGLMRLAKITGLRVQADEAAIRDNREGARKVVREVISIYTDRPDTARSRAALQTNLAEIIDGRDLLRLAERELMTKLDVQARALVTASAQRVSVVTAVSPRALVDVAFVAFEIDPPNPWHRRALRRPAERARARPPGPHGAGQSRGHRWARHDRRHRPAGHRTRPRRTTFRTTRRRRDKWSPHGTYRPGHAQRLPSPALARQQPAGREGDHVDAGGNGNGPIPFGRLSGLERGNDDVR